MSRCEQPGCRLKSMRLGGKWCPAHLPATDAAPLRSEGAPPWGAVAYQSHGPITGIWATSVDARIAAAVERARAEEREACAALCEALEWERGGYECWGHECLPEAAARIRARAKEPKAGEVSGDPLGAVTPLAKAGRGTSPAAASARTDPSPDAAAAIPDGGAGEGADEPACERCGGAVEAVRRVYVHPTCYACLPPPDPIPVLPWPPSAEGAARVAEFRCGKCGGASWHECCGGAFRWCRDCGPLADPEAYRAHTVGLDTYQCDGKVWTNPHRMGGEPCFAGTRLPVSSLWGYIDGGSTDAEIIAEWSHSNLTPELVQVARDFPRPEGWDADPPCGCDQSEALRAERDAARAEVERLRHTETHSSYARLSVQRAQAEAERDAARQEIHEAKDLIALRGHVHYEHADAGFVWRVRYVLDKLAEHRDEAERLRGEVAYLERRQDETIDGLVAAADLAREVTEERDALQARITAALDLHEKYPTGAQGHMAKALRGAG